MRPKFYKILNFNKFRGTTKTQMLNAMGGMTQNSRIMRQSFCLQSLNKTANVILNRTRTEVN